MQMQAITQAAGKALNYAAQTFQGQTGRTSFSRVAAGVLVGSLAAVILRTNAVPNNTAELGVIILALYGVNAGRDAWMGRKSAQAPQTASGEQSEASQQQ